MFARDEVENIGSSITVRVHIFGAGGLHSRSDQDAFDLEESFEVRQIDDHRAGSRLSVFQPVDNLGVSQ